MVVYQHKKGILSRLCVRVMSSFRYTITSRNVGRRQELGKRYGHHNKPSTTTLSARDNQFFPQLFLVARCFLNLNVYQNEHITRTQWRDNTLYHHDKRPIHLIIIGFQDSTFSNNRGSISLSSCYQNYKKNYQYFATLHAYEKLSSSCFYALLWLVYCVS